MLPQLCLRQHGLCAGKLRVRSCRPYSLCTVVALQIVLELHSINTRSKQRHCLRVHRPADGLGPFLCSQRARVQSHTAVMLLRGTECCLKSETSSQKGLVPACKPRQALCCNRTLRESSADENCLRQQAGRSEELGLTNRMSSSTTAISLSSTATDTDPSECPPRVDTVTKKPAAHTGG